MIPFQRAKLLKWATFLETKVPKKHFDMESWSRGPSPCNTAGCALGWATCCFPRSDLKLIATPGWFDEDTWDVSITYREWSGTSAAMKMFGLTADEAEYIVMPESYPSWDRFGKVTPKQAAQHIRKVVRDYDKMTNLERLNRQGGMSYA